MTWVKHEGSGGIDKVVERRAYLGLGLWIPALALVCIGWEGGGGGRVGDEVEVSLFGESISREVLVEVAGVGVGELLVEVGGAGELN